MPHPNFRTAVRLAAVTAAVLGLSACYEVENGPAFSGGDEVPGFDTTLYTVGRISPSDGEAVQPMNPGDIEVWTVRRALNGSYIVEQEGTDDEMVVRPRRIRHNDYVIEYSTATDENWLGILDVAGSGEDRRYNFCIDLDRDEDEVAAMAASHHVVAQTESYTGMTLSAEDPDDLFHFMSELYRRSQLNEWECTVMGPTPPPNMPAPGAGKVPGK